MKDLVEIAKKVKARNAVLASVPGSGFHANDPNSPQKKGLPSVADHVVFFHRKHDVLFVGEDAARAYAALKDLHDRRKAEFDGQPASDERKAVFVVEDVTPSDQGGAPVLTCPLSLWNVLVPALALCGIGVSGAALDGSSVS